MSNIYNGLSGIVTHRSELHGFEWYGCMGGVHDYLRRCKSLQMQDEIERIESWLRENKLQNKMDGDNINDCI